MDALEKLLAPNTQDDLPFQTNLNEQMILDALTREKHISTDMKKKVYQWMKFNKGINEYEEEPYQTWVATVYSKISVLLDSA